MRNEELLQKTKAFAHKCVKLALSLPATSLGEHIRPQLIRSATAIASNFRTACVSESSDNISSRINTIIEESEECAFWLEFIKDEELLETEKLEVLLDNLNGLNDSFNDYQS